MTSQTRENYLVLQSGLMLLSQAEPVDSEHYSICISCLEDIMYLLSINYQSFISLNQLEYQLLFEMHEEPDPNRDRPRSR